MLFAVYNCRQCLLLQEYLKVMAAANFTKDSTVYVASGLLFDGPSPGVAGGAAVVAARGRGLLESRRCACDGS